MFIVGAESQCVLNLVIRPPIAKYQEDVKSTEMCQTKKLHLNIQLGIILYKDHLQRFSSCVMTRCRKLKNKLSNKIVDPTLVLGSVHGVPLHFYRPEGHRGDLHMVASSRIDRGYHNLSKTISFWLFFRMTLHWTDPY